MHNELLHIGPLTVYGYGFMIAMGVLAAWFVAEQRARKLKLACEHIFYLVVWCAIGGFTSAKILFWITNWREFLQNPRQIRLSSGISRTAMWSMEESSEEFWWAGCTAG